MLSLLVSTLFQHLDAGSLPAAPGVRQVMLPWVDGAAAPMLDWLNAWPLYPQCYWQHRDGHEEVAGCGAVRHFSRLGDAQRFLAAQPAERDWRIWGLNAFGADAGEPESALFLPRLSWRRLRDRYQIIMTFYSETSLAADAANFLAWLEAHGTDAPVPLAPLTATVTDVTHLPELPAWRRLVAQALEQFRQGGLEKVVLARRSTLRMDMPPSPLALMAASRQVNHRCFHYLMAWSAHEAFLGSSPERLYHRDHRSLNTEALAGTVACDPDPRQAAEQAAWLMADEKNQRENLLVVDDICQRLRQAARALDVSGPEIIRLRTVQHLRRGIQGDLPHADDSLCLALLQPTAAVAGLPRQPAAAFIQRHESFARRWYAGSAGYLTLDESEFCVALRCARVSSHQIWLYAGAGIVPGSDADQEWQEVENKAAGLQSLFTGAVQE